MVSALYSGVAEVYYDRAQQGRKGKGYLIGAGCGETSARYKPAEPLPRESSEEW